MKLLDWTYLTAFLFANVLGVPAVIHILDVRSPFASYLTHVFMQLMYHRNINNHAAKWFQNKYGLLKSESPRSRLSAKDIIFTKLSGVAGAMLRIGTLFLAAGSQRNDRFSISPWWIATYPVYVLTLDLVFYWAHRMQHEYPLLYRYIHRKHHEAHLPNVLLTVHDTLFEKTFNTFVQCVLLNWLVPMSFWELHTTYYAIHLIEALGHSGIRCHLTNPLLVYLTLTEQELSIEDHDLHHRRLHGNYGKQTRVWDQFFGTVLSRIET